MIKVFFRAFGSSSSSLKEIPNNLKGKSVSSQNWMARHIKDPYVENARMQNYRCRSAFKLLEIDAKYKFFHPGQCVLDCGASPGSWTQVSIDKTNALLKDENSLQGFVVGIDIIPIYPISGAILLNCDIQAKSSQDKIREILKDKEVDVVLSDMAPNATGIKSMDHDAIVNLVYQFVRFGLGINKIGGTMLLKLWEGSRTSSVEADLKRFYSSVKRVKPAASRGDSSEMFILALGFKGIEK